MKNYGQPGDVLEFTAPAGGVVAGTAYLIGSLLVVALISAAAAAKFTGACAGVFDLTKASGAWTEGQNIYWDNTAKNFTTTATANFYAGVAAAAAAAGDATGSVRLNGIGIKAAG